MNDKAVYRTAPATPGLLNISRNEDITRSITNDENIRFEINSAVYLEVKKKASELKRAIL